MKKQKTEAWRLGNESSEDAVTWNVFAGLAQLGGLRDAFKLLCGIAPKAEPQLFFWGISVWPEYRPGTWERLLEARRECGELKNRIQTEPDVMLYVAGQALTLIEAKFGSPNSTLGKKRPPQTVAKFLKNYAPPRNRTDPLARDEISQLGANVVLEQLCRNSLFAHYMAQEGEKAFVANLVRAADETDVKKNMDGHLSAQARAEFRRVTWEDLARLPAVQSAEAEPLRRYFRAKTLRLKKAFAI